MGFRFIVHDRHENPLTSALSPSKKGEREINAKADQHLAAKLCVLDYNFLK